MLPRHPGEVCTRVRGREFCELRRDGVLGSSPRELQKILHLSDALPFFGEYGAIVAWPRRPPRKGSGQLPTLLLDLGQLPQNLTLSKGEEALRVGKQTGMRGDLLLAGLALFCLGILLSFLATATTEVSSAAAGKAVANVDGEALARLDKEASGPLTPAAQEARQT